MGRHKITFQKHFLLFMLIAISLCIMALPAYADGIHSNYSATTDACGVCHAVHEGNGSAMLRWDTFTNTGLTEVCLSCHDGTDTNTYNVINGTYLGTDDQLPHHNSGGLFALQNNPNADSGSQHGVFGDVIVNAAFGGANLVDAQSDSHGRWVQVFDCVNCHTPHGQGGNVRILEPNPNWVQTHGQDPTQYAGKTGVFVATADGSSTSYNWPNSDKPLLGFPYDSSTRFYINDQVTTAASIIFDPGGTNFRLKFTSPPATGASIKVDYTPVLVVSGSVSNMLTSQESAAIYSGMNAFCGACHTDYDTETIKADPSKNGPNGSGSVLSGIYGRQHTRHQVGMVWNDRKTAESRGLKFEGTDPKAGVVTCLTCHFAHGTDKENAWKGIADATGNQAAYNSELSGSSRLKRLPNMGVCEVCHDKADASYSANI